VSAEQQPRPDERTGASATVRDEGGDGGSPEREFFRLELDPSNRSGRFTVADGMSNPRGSFYGGAGVAVACLAMEAATGRRSLWTTLQFPGTANRGDQLDVDVDVVAHGRRTSQVRVTARLDGAEVFTALGATGEARDGVPRSFGPMPVVRDPLDSPVHHPDYEGEVARSKFGATEYRIPAEPEELAATGTHAAWWMRVPGLTASAALLGYISDVVALGVFAAIERDQSQTRATSLDNTLRVGALADTEWVLVDVRAELVADGYAHGSSLLWAPDGTLLGVASQTLALRTAPPTDAR
jgi:acyl-CoA thioesterase